MLKSDRIKYLNMQRDDHTLALRFQFDEMQCMIIS